MNFLPPSTKGRILLISGIFLIILGTIIWGYVLEQGTVNGTFDEYVTNNKQGTIIASAFQLAGSIPIIILFINAEKFYNKKSGQMELQDD